MNRAELTRLYEQPLFSLLKQAREAHEGYWKEDAVQLCTLLSIKTGACSEDCGYCAQSSRYSTGIEREALMEKEEVLRHARAAKEAGSHRFCMGAAWRGVRKGTERFEQVLGIVRGVADLGLEVCVTLGELGEEEARLLKEAGVHAYNHNIDTSPEHYPNVVTSHTFEDRLNTIKHVQKTGMHLCCGGILGLGEKLEDRLEMVSILSEMDPVPESVPINTLVPIEGTPMEGADPIDIFDLVRLIAVARIAIPTAKIRLSAGRSHLTKEGQALCFFAGANSVFYGDKLLTTSNASTDRDKALLKELGLKTVTAE